MTQEQELTAYDVFNRQYIRESDVKSWKSMLRRCLKRNTPKALASTEIIRKGLAKWANLTVLSNEEYDARQEAIWAEMFKTERMQG